MVVSCKGLSISIGGLRTGRHDGVGLVYRGFSDQFVDIQFIHLVELVSLICASSLAGNPLGIHLPP